jgi:hypothetical protein
VAHAPAPGLVVETEALWHRWRDREQGRVVGVARVAHTTIMNEGCNTRFRLPDISWVRLPFKIMWVAGSTVVEAADLEADVLHLGSRAGG